jgi:hypothetical protein
LDTNAPTIEIQIDQHIPVVRPTPTIDDKEPLRGHQVDGGIRDALETQPAMVGVLVA